ncbi:MAG: phosphotransferase [Dehalococcoidia bacterium]
MISREADLFDIQSKLLDWLRGKMPQARDMTVSNMERSGAGFTSESFLFDLGWKEGGEDKSAGMVLRCEGTSYPTYPDPKVKKQFQILERLAATNVPVPGVYWFEDDPSLLGTPFYVMEKLDGIVPSEFPPYHSYGICYDAPVSRRERMWWGVFEALAALHLLDWKGLDLAFLGIPGEGAGPLEADLDYWGKYLNWARDEPEERHPVLEAALGWLRRNLYEPEHLALCWGDARLPNAIFSPDGGLQGLLDWDIAWLGDPESDLAFVLTLDHLLGEGIGVPRLEGLPGKEETVKRYEALTGRKVRHLFYNEVRAACVAGLHILKVQKNLARLGASLPGDDPERDNFCTQYLASLLGLPAPGEAAKEIGSVEELEATVQFHLTGPDAADWYVTCEKGSVTRREGIVESPDTTVTVPAITWAAIRKGEMNQFHAWTSGELQIEGDHTLLHLLEAMIARLGD